MLSPSIYELHKLEPYNGPSLKGADDPTKMALANILSDTEWILGNE